MMNEYTITKQTTPTPSNKTYERINKNKDDAQHGRSPRVSKTNTPHFNLYIGILNTRTLKEEHRVTELEHALNMINLDVLGISEIRRN